METPRELMIHCRLAYSMTRWMVCGLKRNHPGEVFVLDYRQPRRQVIH